MDRVPGNQVLTVKSNQVFTVEQFVMPVCMMKSAASLFEGSLPQIPLSCPFCTFSKSAPTRQIRDRIARATRPATPRGKELPPAQPGKRQSQNRRKELRLPHPPAVYVGFKSSSQLAVTLRNERLVSMSMTKRPSKTRSVACLPGIITGRNQPI